MQFDVDHLGNSATEMKWDFYGSGDESSASEQTSMMVRQERRRHVETACAWGTVSLQFPCTLVLKIRYGTLELSFELSEFMINT